MKIVLVMDQFDDANNGTTIAARRLAENLQAHGHTITSLACGEQGEGLLRAKHHKVFLFERLIRAQGMYFAKPDPLLYYEAFRDADVAHFFIPFRFCRQGERYARQMRLPCVSSFHAQPENITSSLFLEWFSGLNDWLYRHFYRTFYNRFSFIHCPSHFIASQLDAHGYDAEIRVVSNGVDRAFTRGEVERPEELRGRIVILMVGRLSREKRQDLIIRAAARSKYADRIQLIFAGQGPRELQYRRLGRQLPLPPIFQFFSQEELLKTIRMSDLYIHASDAEIEGISCLEAMACGLVPVISDAPKSATKQFALHEHSLFKAGDPTDLASKIEFWIDNPEEKARLSRMYEESQDNNRTDQCVARMEQLYQDAVNKTRTDGFKAVPLSRLRRLFVPKKRYLNLHLNKNTLGQPKGLRRLANACCLILTPIHKLFLGLRVKGRDNLDIPGGAITVMNHAHMIDCTMIKPLLKSRGLWMVSLEENFGLAVIGRMIRALGAVSLGHTQWERAELMNGLKRRINQGDFVHFFPEGMLLPGCETLRIMHDGAFSLAACANCPIIPMVLTKGTHRGLLRSKRKPGLTIHILPPEYPNSSLPAKQARAELNQRVRQAMASLINEVHGENDRERAPGVEALP